MELLPAMLVLFLSGIGLTILWAIVTVITAWINRNTKMKTAFGLLAAGFALIVAAYNDGHWITRLIVLILAAIAFVLLLPTIAT